MRLPMDTSVTAIPRDPRRAREPGSRRVGAGGGDAPPAPKASSEVPMHQQFPRRALSAATLLWWEVRA
jgi:hypothetical protein